ncbi:helix-turn-helix domain-containing protein [Alistipes timonensis]|uniref:helix-turn-helix domain-containing protein n=1 Tax=Alistipes timonensis TaxID=1465754 RepID=UPI00214BCFC5|nr:helix-turn-helix domain-containing protein [Alistipes timonensis]MCR2031606.1 helix-turn-helix domain-containing protein [Alistipes timonensis]
MFPEKEYFDLGAQQIIERLERIEQLCLAIVPPNATISPANEKLLDNYDVCQMLNISKRTLQRYRSLGDLPYQMIYHKTLYKEKDVREFIARHFNKFRKMKKRE